MSVSGQRWRGSGRPSSGQLWTAHGVGGRHIRDYVESGGEKGHECGTACRRCAVRGGPQSGIWRRTG